MISCSLPTVIYNALKWVWSFLIGSVWYLLEPSIPFIRVCLIAFIVDVFTAWRLNRRCRKRWPEYADGKIHSDKLGNVLTTMFILFGCIALANHLETDVLHFLGNIYLANWVCAIYVIRQGLSIAENISSANDAPWAKALQRIVADKVARHLDINQRDANDLLRKHHTHNKPSDDFPSAPVTDASPSGSPSDDGAESPTPSDPVPDASTSDSNAE